MAKIVSMSSGAIDPIAQTKRVFWRPVTSTTVLKVGQPVCYNSDAVCDHKERTSDPTHLGLAQDTYAEGAQDFTGRLFIVEEPLTANLHAPAGIVKSLGPKAGADGDMIEIFVPNGAIVPVWTDQYCTNDRTIMGIRNGEADVSYPGRPIGVAKETKDRSGTPGLVWAKIDPNMFLYQYQASALNIPDECGAAVVLNQLSVTSAQTAGNFEVLNYDGKLTGAGSCINGMYKFFATLDAAASHYFTTCQMRLIFGADAEITNPGGVNAVLQLRIDEDGDDQPDLTGGDVCALSCEYYLDETGGAPRDASVIDVVAGTYKFHYLLRTQNAGDAGESDHAGGAGKVVGFDGDTDIVKIPVKIAGSGTDYYILAGQTMNQVNHD